VHGFAFFFAVFRFFAVGFFIAKSHVLPLYTAQKDCALKTIVAQKKFIIKMTNFAYFTVKEGPLTTSNQFLSPYTVALRLR
jgi:hypothetical protein